MKNKFFWLALLLAAITLLNFASCKKGAVNTITGNQEVNAEDNDEAIAAINSSTDDAANVAAGMPSSGKTSDGDDHGWHYCGVSIDNVMRDSGIITINYTGQQCFSHITKTGSITITMENYLNGVRWADAGATLRVDFNNLMISDNSTGNSYTLNGTHYLTNVTGGMAWHVMFGLQNTTVTYRHIADNFTIAFSDGTQRVWSIRRSVSFSNINGVKAITFTGDTTINGTTGVAVWGTNRASNSFSTALVSPIVSTTRCGLYRPVSGEYNYHSSGGNMLDILYGVDRDGNIITNNDCPYGYKITYSDSGQIHIKVIRYHYEW